jgi:hypothetical protein
MTQRDAFISRAPVSPTHETRGRRRRSRYDDAISLVSFGVDACGVESGTTVASIGSFERGSRLSHMGLGIEMRAIMKTRPLLGRRRALAKLVGEAAEVLREAAVRQFAQLQGYARTFLYDGEWLVRLHPAEEEVRLRDSEGEVVFSARTNGCGPGYHAFIVQLMDEVAAATGLQWLPALEGDEESEGFEDETGFFESRNFVDLQRQMASWLRAVAKTASEAEPGDGPCVLCMPLGTPTPVGWGGALSPMGHFKKAWLEETVLANSDLLLLRAAEFFPWWTQGVDRRTIQNLGRVVLNQFP